MKVRLVGQLFATWFEKFILGSQNRQIQETYTHALLVLSGMSS